MPEHAEIRIMADFINSFNAPPVSARYSGLRKSAVSKVECDLTPPGVPFYIQAASRGKELGLRLIPVAGGEEARLTMTMGMSGNITGARCHRPDTQVKHLHLIFEGEDASGAPLSISVNDQRRFAKWRRGGWSPSRGPDPVHEHAEFRDNVARAAERGDRRLLLRVCEALLDQGLFNGVGNYLRAQVLGHAGISPFISLGAALAGPGDLLGAVRECCEAAYRLNGGQLRDWRHPEGRDPAEFQRWLRFYGNDRDCFSFVDGTGRRMWADARWLGDCPYTVRTAPRGPVRATNNTTGTA